MDRGLLPAGVVFDCDGTIADTESLSDRAWTELLTTAGYAPTFEDYRAVIGHPWPHNWAYFSARVDLGAEQQFRSRLRRRFHELLDQELSVHEDAVTTLRDLAAAEVPIAVASSSTRAHVMRVLEVAAVTDLVQTVVGVDDVERHKPDPLPYLTAAAAIGIDPARCAAVEDTPVGVQAALDAGMFTVAVVRAHGEPSWLAAASRVVDTVTLDALRSPELEPTGGGEPRGAGSPLESGQAAR